MTATNLGTKIIVAVLRFAYILLVAMPAIAFTNWLNELARVRDPQYSLVARHVGRITYAIAWLVMLPFHRGREEIIAEWEASGC